MELVFIMFVLVTTYMDGTESVGRQDVFSTNTMLMWLNTEGLHRSNYLDYNFGFAMSTTSCKGINLNMVVRNAAHFPAREIIQEAKALQEKIVAAKDPAMFAELNNWRIPSLESAGTLMLTGMEEIYELGRRIGQGVRHGLNKFLDISKSVKFVSSSDSVAIDSSKYFYRGFVSHIDRLPTSFEPELNDTTMRFPESCYNREKQLQNKSAFLKDFLREPEFTNITESLQLRLGIQMNFTEDEVFLINDWCACGMSISGDTTWCKLLSDDDRLVLEYAQDLLNYYLYSYGNPINAKMSCGLVQDILSSLDASINRSLNYFNDEEIKETSYVAGKFQFGHADTIIPFVTALGLFKDQQPLLATNMAAMKDRKFKTSQIVPFAGSVVFVLYACDNIRRIALNEFGPGQQTIRIQAFINEVKVPFCEHQYYCMYDSGRQNFLGSNINCNMTEICGSKPREATTQKKTESLKSGADRAVTCLATVLLIFFLHVCNMYVGNENHFSFFVH